MVRWMLSIVSCLGWYKSLTRHGTGRKKLKVYPPPPTVRSTCKDPVGAVTEAQLATLDPTGERKALFDYRRNPRSVKVGDILRVTFKNGDPFSGVCLSIRLRGIDTAFLMRNELTRVGVEMWVKVFSPNVESVEIVQRTEKRKRRARLYYMRCVNPHIGRLSPIHFLSHPRMELTSLRYSLGSPSMTWAAWRTSCPTTFGRSLLLLGREDLDRNGNPGLVQRHLVFIFGECIIIILCIWNLTSMCFNVSLIETDRAYTISLRVHIPTLPLCARCTSEGY